MRLPPLPTISEIVRLYRLQARKHLAQNFLLDTNVTRKIVRQAGKFKDGFVCEVGPGPGGITRAIMDGSPSQLIVVEKDARFLPSLQLMADSCNDHMKIVHGDILNFDMEEIIPNYFSVPWSKPPPNIHIIGNLPFNISTPLIIKYLEHIANKTGAWKYGRTKLTLTFQKEIADRMVAPILHEQRSRLSIMCQYLCDVQLKYEIPGKVFVPPPKVDVGVVHFIPLIQPKIDLPFKLVEKVCRHVFHYRQKIIKNSVATLFPVSRPELTSDIFMLSDLSHELRPTQLHVNDMNRLCLAYHKICQQNPGIYEFDYRAKKINMSEEMETSSETMSNNV